jgi:hypothetical protein
MSLNQNSGFRYLMYDGVAQFNLTQLISTLYTLSAPKSNHACRQANPYPKEICHEPSKTFKFPVR